MRTNKSKKVYDKIHVGLNEIINDHEFVNWATKKGLDSGDIVCVNNSFIHRYGVRTNKNPKYLGFVVDEKGGVGDIVVISYKSGSKQNNDFKRIKYSSNLDVKKVYPEIQKESKNIGKLLYILIGTINEDITVSEEFKSTLIREIVFNPTFEKIEVSNKKLIINDTSNEEKIWKFLSNEYKNNQNFKNHTNEIKEELGNKIDLIESKAYSNLNLPSKVSELENTINITDSLVRSLDEQYRSYNLALHKLKGNVSSDKRAMNEVLRISYNFTSDVIPFIKLIVSICDLKPLVLWGTIYYHFQVSECFKKLPWQRSKKKPSLKNYIDTIGNARNSAFHHLFPFKRTLKVQLPDDAIRQASITMFSDYSKKKENKLVYEDQELVDVLTEFTRSNEHKISHDFWEKNLEIMKSTINLFSETSTFLRVLFQEINAN